MIDSRCCKANSAGEKESGQKKDCSIVVRAMYNLFGNSIATFVWLGSCQKFKRRLLLLQKVSQGKTQKNREL